MLTCRVQLFARALFYTRSMKNSEDTRKVAARYEKGLLDWNVGILMFVDVVVVDAVKDHDNILNISGCSHSIRVIFNAHTYNFNGYTLRLTTFSDGESK